MHGHDADRPRRQKGGEFQATARPEFDEGRERIDMRQDVVRPTLEQALLGSGDLVPRQTADRLEKRRPELAVQVVGRQLTRAL